MTFGGVILFHLPKVFQITVLLVYGVLHQSLNLGLGFYCVRTASGKNELNFGGSDCMHIWKSGGFGTVFPLFGQMHTI